MTKKYDRWKLAQEAEKDWWDKYFKGLVGDGYLILNKDKIKEYNLIYHQEYLLRNGFDPAFFINKTVVEIGCGPIGFVSDTSTSCGIGIDPLMSQFIKTASKLEKNYYIQGIGENVPIKTDSIDVVICHNVLDHVSHPAKVIAEIRRILKKDGLLLIQIDIENTIFKIIRNFAEFIKAKNRDMPHPHSFTIREIIELLDSNKLSFISGRYKVNLIGNIKNKNRIKRFVISTLNYEYPFDKNSFEGVFTNLKF